MKKNLLNRKFWVSMLIFGLVGQIAWVVENMYFNVFIYKMFAASASQISAMVSASAVAAAVTTILMGELSDRLATRKLFICLGYILWGITILSFAFIRMDILTPMVGSTAAAAALGINLVIVMDCVMTFFGSAANDAAYNAWITDCGDEGTRGKIEGLNAMMPLVSILVVFGDFMGFNLDLAKSWTTIYIIIGAVVCVIGVVGFFLIEEEKKDRDVQKGTYWMNIVYSFTPKAFKKSPMLYAVLFAYALFGISIQVFMPYLILYYEKSLAMANYVFIMAPAIILAAVMTVFYGRLYDKKGFTSSIVIAVALLMGGYVMLYLFQSTALVFVGSLLMMCGYMAGMTVFGAKVRAHIPEHHAGQFQGVRIIAQVLIPGVIGPALGAWVLRDAELIVNSDGTTSFLPNQGIFLWAFIAAAVLCIALVFVCRADKKKNA
ncbi:MAG: MFS transporter [Clostridia bacterium]|nr:MFS transporter [Clostridia bacterium]